MLTIDKKPQTVSALGVAFGALGAAVVLRVGVLRAGFVVEIGEGCGGSSVHFVVLSLCSTYFVPTSMIHACARHGKSLHNPSRT